jgi:rubredoxin
MDDQSLDEHFRCPNCRRSFKHKKNLYRHLRQGCDEITSEAAATAGQRDGQSSHIPIFRCSLCSYTTYLRASLFQHTQIEHEQTYEQVIPPYLRASSIHFLLNSFATQNVSVADQNTSQIVDD